MQPGSVIVDVAAEAGGRELTAGRDGHSERGQIVGPFNLPSMPRDERAVFPNRQPSCSSLERRQIRLVLNEITVH